MKEDLRMDQKVKVINKLVKLQIITKLNTLLFDKRLFSGGEIMIDVRTGIV